MDRRGFLSTVGLGAASTAFQPFSTLNNLANITSQSPALTANQSVSANQITRELSNLDSGYASSFIGRQKLPLGDNNDLARYPSKQLNKSRKETQSSNLDKAELERKQLLANILHAAQKHAAEKDT